MSTAVTCQSKLPLGYKAEMQKEEKIKALDLQPFSLRIVAPALIYKADSYGWIGWLELFQSDRLFIRRLVG